MPPKAKTPKNPKASARAKAKPQRKGTDTAYKRDGITPPSSPSSSSSDEDPSAQKVKPQTTPASTTHPSPAKRAPLPLPKRQKPPHLYALHLTDYTLYERAEKLKASPDPSARATAAALQERLARSRFGYIRANALWSLTYYYRRGRDPDYALRLGLAAGAVAALAEDVADDGFDYVQMDLGERMRVYVERRGEIEGRAGVVRRRREERERERRRKREEKEKAKSGMKVEERRGGEKGGASA